MSTKIIISMMLLALVALFAVGCSDDDKMTGPETDNMYDSQLDEAAMLDADGKELDGTQAAHFGRHGEPVTFVVRVENVSTGTTLMLSNGGTAPAPHSPGVWTITRLFNPLFRVNHYDLGLGMEQQAEDGNPSMLAESMENRWGVTSSGIFLIPEGDTDPGPATPGKAFVFEVTARPGDRLSLSTMFGQSNDLFYSPGRFGIPLFTWRGAPRDGDVTHYFKLWDAGTEVNQEPGLGEDQAPRQSGPNTGESEHKRVRVVDDGYYYPATHEVIKVTITPMMSS